jgi:SAM-dependent methyltransferase
LFDFIRKRDIWALIDDGVLDELSVLDHYELKTAQDVAVYALLRGSRNLRIAEVGGGNARILGRLAEDNRCWNIDRFEGVGVGPTTVATTPNVSVLEAYIGDFDPDVPSEFFDIVFSISVVEHVGTDRLDLFHQDLLRTLRPGGLFVHAIDMYLTDEPPADLVDRYDAYRSWLTEARSVEPYGEVREGIPAFTCDLATNPDNVLLDWGRLVPELRQLRESAQNVSLLVAGRKKAPADAGAGGSIPAR